MNLQSKKARVPIAALGVTALVCGAGALMSPAFAATGLHEASADSGEEERIEMVPWPLSDLDSALAECRDAKTLIALDWLVRRLNA